jgi:hypothetical protein
MDKATFMEWLIRPFAGKDRAAAMLGDLLETDPSAGRFWVSSFALLISVSWRPCTALALANASFSITWVGAFNGWVSISRHMWVNTGGTTTWAPNAEMIGREAAWAYLLGWVAQLECVSAVFALVLYGIRDTLTAISAVLGGLSIALCWFLPSAPLRTGLLCGLALAVVIALTATRKSRRALAILTLTTCASVVLGALMLRAGVSFHSPAVASAFLGMIPLINGLAISRLHRMFAVRG